MDQNRAYSTWRGGETNIMNMNIEVNPVYGSASEYDYI